MKHGSSKKRSLEKKLALAMSVVNVLNAGAPVVLPYVHVAQNVRAEGGHVEGLADALTRTLFSTAYAAGGSGSEAQTTVPPDETRELVSGSGTQTINGGTGTITTLVNGGQQIVNGGTGKVENLNDGGTQIVNNGGSGKVTILSGGTIFHNGGDGNVSIGAWTGGTLIMDGGAITTGANLIPYTISNGTIVFAQNWGGSINTITLQGDSNGQGVMMVSCDTQDTDHLLATTISNGGTQIVAAGEGYAGKVKSTTISAGGTQIVQGGALAKQTTDAGGVLELHGGAILQNAGGTAITYNNYALQGGTLRLVDGAAVGETEGTNMTITNGTLELGKGGTATGTVLSKTDNKIGVERVNGGLSISATVRSGGTQTILAGEATSATINNGGVQDVSGGTVSGTTINGGEQVVSGGAVSGTTIKGGTQTVSGGTVNDTSIGGIEGGEMLTGTQIVSGGTVSGTTIKDGGTQTVNDGTVNGTIISKGEQTVSGGTVNGTTVDDGWQYVRGGTVSGTIISNRGVQNVSGGTVSGTIISNRGVQHVSGGTVSGTTIKDGGTQTVNDGATAKGTTVSAGGKQYVIGTADHSGYASDTVISAGGTQNIMQYGVADGGTIKGVAAKQNINAGGTALDMHVENGGLQSVSGTEENSGYVSGTVISAGGMQNIEQYGVAEGVTISGAGAIQNVNGGTAKDTTVNNGATQNIEAKGTASGGTIAGTQNVKANATATGATIAAGGTQNVEAGATAKDTTVKGKQDATAGGVIEGDKNSVEEGGVVSGGTLTGKQTVKTGGLTDGLTIDEDAVQTVSGTAKDTTVNDGGTLDATAGGILAGSNNIVNAGGVVVGGTLMTVNDVKAAMTVNGGSVTDTTIDKGGVQNVTAGTVTNVNVGGTQTITDGEVTGGNVTGTQNVNGGSVTGTTIDKGGVQTVTAGTVKDVNVSGEQNVNGGEVSGGTVTGRQNVNGGKVTDTIIGDGGLQTVTSGTVTNVNVVRGTQTVSGGEVTGGTVTGTQNVNGGTVTSATIKDNGKQNVNENGTALNTTVGASGAQGVASGGIATGTIISGGTQNVFAGATVTDTTINDGTQELYGTADGETKLLGGTQNVYEGAKAEGVVVSGGTQNVKGKVTSTTIAGGEQVISAGGTATYTVLNGGTQTLMSGTSEKNPGGVSEHITLAGGTLIVDDYATAQVDSATSGAVKLLEDGGATIIFGDTTLTGSPFNLTTLDATGDHVRLGLGDENNVPQVGKVLNIGTMTGNANFYINTDLAANNADVVNITNSDAQESKIRINYDPTLATGATVAVTDTTVATVGDANATFAGAESTIGGNSYTPTVTSDDGGATWKITQVALTGPSEQLKAAEGAASARTAAWRGTASIQAVGNRLGRLRTADRMKDDIEGRVHDDIWVDFTRGRNTLGNNGRSVRATYSRVDIGFDRSVGKGWTVGAAYGLQYGTENYGIGTGNSHNDILTAYAMWQSPKDHYLEMTLRAGRFSSDYDLQDPNQAAASEGSSRTYGQAASVVYGKRMAQASDWYMEPHAGLYWAHMNGYGYDLSDGTAVHVDGSNSFIGALGVNVGRSLSNGSQFYSRLDVMHDFAGSTRTTMTKGASNTLENDFRDTWVDLMLGFARKDGVIDWYAEAGRQGMGSKECRGDWVWRVGMSYSF